MAQFFKCNHCNNIIYFVSNKGAKVSCCGEEMTELVAGSVDAAFEKHVPVVEVNGNNINVKVGAAPHPMTEPHYIEWIALETTNGIQIKYLKHDEESAQRGFVIADGEKAIKAYAYCNLHGLWEAKI